MIGGGPAGSAVSTLVAQQGYRVQLFERERFPRFHIGESLIPKTYWVLKRLNMLPKMQKSVGVVASFDYFFKGRRYPELRDTLTDLLIGDLFTDRVDKVWQPLESLYEPGKRPIPRWDAGTPVELATDKANELVLPEGRRP